MLFGLMVFLFVFICVLLILLILIQKGNSSLGLGNIGGSNTLLFGGSGGQDVFQKITWVLGALFMGGSLVLAIVKTNQMRSSRYFDRNRVVMPRTQKETIPSSEQTPEPVPAPKLPTH